MALATDRGTAFAFANNTVTGIPAAGNTDILEFLLPHIAQTFVQFSVATQALDAFIVLGRARGATSYVTLYNAITATPGGLILAASGTLATTAAAGTGWFMMNTLGLDAIKIQVSAAVDGAAVTMYASGFSMN